MERLISIGSDYSTWCDEDWKIVTSNIPVTMVAAPTTKVRFNMLEPDDTLPGQFGISTNIRKRFIDEVTHKNMLEKNIKEYESIWRTLAEK